MKKILSIWLSIILVMGILFSYAYLSENTHHDCQEKECHVCVGLVTALKFVSGLKALSALPFLAAVLTVSIGKKLFFARPRAVKNTLITLKVELLN